MKKRKIPVKNQNRIQKSRSLAAVFVVTLVAVLTAGLLGMLVYSVLFRDTAVSLQTKGEEGEERERTELLLTPLVEMIPEELEEKETPSPQPEVKKPGKYDQLLADEAFMAENNIYALPNQNEGIVTLGFAGDILFDDEYAIMVKMLGRGGKMENGISAELLTKMRDVDIMMVNNEFPYTDRGTPTEGKTYTFRADPDTVGYLDDMGVDIVSLANNHMFDFGETGLLDTLVTLEGAAIPYVGAGRNIDEASGPVYFICGDIKIAVVSATQIERLENPDTREATANRGGVFRCLDPTRLYEVVAKAKENSDFVVVFVHWGTENVAEPDWAQLDQSKGLAEAGADLVIGAHSHCLQGIQYYGDVPVIYSLGNFWFNSKTLDTCMIQADISEKGLEALRFIPAIQSDCYTDLAYGDEKQRIIRYMESISFDITIDEEGRVTPNPKIEE